MSIRWQNIFAIVPIFFAVGLASGFLRLESDKNEMLWGFREQSLGVSAAVAAFLDGDRWSAVERGEKEAIDELTRKLARIFHSGNARQVFGLNAEGDQVRFNTAPSQNRKFRPMIDPAAFESLRAGEGYVTEIQTDLDGSARMIAYSAVKDTEGTVRGVIGAVVSADEFSRAYTSALWQAGWLCAAATGLGLIVALGISAVFCARLRDLKNAAERLAKGDYSQRLESGLVRELSDLTDTFNTVGSILDELAAKSRRNVVDAEQFRTDEELKASFREHCYPPAWRDAGAIRVAGCLAGMQAVGDFFEIFPAENGTYALFGRVLAETVAERMTQASAAQALSREVMLALGVEEAAKRVRENFTIVHWECVFAEASSGRVYQWKLRSDGALERRDLGVPDSPRVFHSLSDGAARNIERYLASVPEISAGDLLAELGPFLGTESQGAAVIVGNFSAA